MSLRDVQIKTVRHSHFREIESKLMNEHGCRWPGIKTTIKLDKGEIKFPAYILVDFDGTLFVSTFAKPNVPFYELELIPSPEKIEVDGIEYNLDYIRDILKQQTEKITTVSN